LRVRLEIENGILKDIVFQYESFINGQWIPIVRYDIAHGFFHRDIMSPSGEKEKYPIEIYDLKVAASYAEQDIKDKWEFYKEKYVRKMKK
jgi:hypothetical protein